MKVTVCVGLDRTAQHSAAVGVQAAGNVERKHRRGLAIDPVDQSRVAALDLTLEADAEQGIDHQIDPVDAGAR